MKRQRRRQRERDKHDVLYSLVPLQCTLSSNGQQGDSCYISDSNPRPFPLCVCVYMCVFYIGNISVWWSGRKTSVFYIITSDNDLFLPPVVERWSSGRDWEGVQTQNLNWWWCCCFWRSSSTHWNQINQKWSPWWWRLFIWTELFFFFLFHKYILISF